MREILEEKIVSEPIQTYEAEAQAEVEKLACSFFDKSDRQDDYECLRGWRKKCTHTPETPCPAVRPKQAPVSVVEEEYYDSLGPIRRQILPSEGKKLDFAHRLRGRREHWRL